MKKNEIRMEMKCAKCGAKVVMVEYFYSSPEHYDGISEYQCSKQCGWRIGRWSGIELKENEIEGRYGKNSPILIKKQSWPINKSSS